jgi:hypothetical protein
MGVAIDITAPIGKNQFIAVIYSGGEGTDGRGIREVAAINVPSIPEKIRFTKLSAA